MQIKIILVLIIISCSYLLGEQMSKVYSKRHLQVNEVIRILELIRMDLSFGMYTLDEIFRRIGEKNDYSISSFFELVSKELRENTHKTLDEIIDIYSFKLLKENYLNQSDVEELKSVLITLGKSDITSQQRLIDLSIENFKKTTFETKEDIEKKGNVYKKLSTIIGIMISIILI